MAYMKLLSAGVSAKQCPSVVQIVLAAQPCCDLDINVGDLPSRTFANTLRNELAALCKIDMAVKIGDHAHQHVVLGSDEGTCNQESSNALVAHYNDIPSQCLGVDKMGSHFSQEGADKTQKMMESYGVLSKRVSSSLGKIDLSGAERDLVYSAAAFSSTITDQCNTQKKTNSLLDDIKAMKVAQWNEAATQAEKDRRKPELDGNMAHIFCYIHAGVNLASKFGEVFRCHGATSSGLRSNVDDDAEEDADAEPDQAPDEYEMEAIVASRLRPGASAAEYRIRWKGWPASYDTWEPASNMLHAEDMIAQHAKTGQAVLAGKKTKVSRVSRRSVSKVQQVVYEVGKFLCVQSGKGVKEDQRGVAFMKWCLGKGYKDHLKTHLKMKPVVGTRYFVYHYNPRIIFALREVYLEYIEHVRSTKTAKTGLNRLEASVKKLLEDEQCLAQMRAAVILCEQIEEPILWLAKRKTALEMRQVSADVLAALVSWATPEGAATLLQRPGTLISQAYAHAKDNALMASLIAPHTTDDQVRDMLQSCCMLGVDHWLKHTGFGLDGHEARHVTEADKLCIGNAPANNDACERVIARIRYLKTKAPNMRSGGAEALIMAVQNDPFASLHAGQLGKIDEVLELARVMAKENMKKSGTHLDECERIVKDQQHYQDLYGPKPSQAPAAVTRRDNLAAAIAAAADVEGNLMFSEDELRAMKTSELHALKRGWIQVGQVAFGNGARWQAIFTKDGQGSGAPNAQGKCGVIKDDYITDLLAASKSYSELLQENELPSSEGENSDPAPDPVTDPTADPTADPVADPAADPAPDPDPAPVASPSRSPAPPPAPSPAAAPPASDRSRRTAKPLNLYDPAKDGANDQTRLGKAKAKKPKRRKK